MSTRMCRLRPLTFLPRRSLKDRAKPPFLSTPCGLRVDDRCRRTGFTSFLLAHCNVKRVVDAFHSAIPVPELEIVVHRALRRQVFGQRLPLASGPEHVENPVQDFAHVDRAFASTVSPRRNIGRQWPIRRQSDRLDNAGPCVRGAARSGVHMGRSFANLAPNEYQIRFIRLKNFPDRLKEIVPQPPLLLAGTIVPPKRFGSCDQRYGASCFTIVRRSCPCG